MSIVLSIARGITSGILIGCIIALITHKLGRKSDDRRQEQLRRVSRAVAGVSIAITLLALFIGLVWTAYFLVLGLAEPAQMDYAAGAASLIVAVLTVISIITAFFQFLREKR